MRMRTESRCRQLAQTSLTLLVTLMALMLGACGGNDADPVAVAAGYLEAFNTDDAEAVMAFYAEDGVIEGHPDDSGGLATGKAEILFLEELVDGYQGSTGMLEYINMEASGNTVTFDTIFRNAQGRCFSFAGTELTVENDLIALVVWGERDQSFCG